MLLADREEKRHKEHGRSSKRTHHHENDYSSPSKQQTPTMMDMSMLNFQAAQT
jgi:hypothetical protein